MNRTPIKKIELCGNYKIITTNDAKYFVKKQKHYDQERVYTLLEERGFHHFLKPLEILPSKEEVFPFIEEKTYNYQEKAIDMMHVLSLLQNKTTFYKEISLDEVKQLYEETKRNINYLFLYYEDLEEHLFKEVYPSPSAYLLQRNFSMLFLSLSFASEKLEEWYQIIQEKSCYRVVLVHHKFSLSHLLEANEPYLISLDALDYGLPIEDIIFFFKEHCLEQDLYSLFMIYQQKYPFTKEEFALFSCFLAIPDKLEIEDASYASCLLLSEALEKMNCIRLFLLKQNEQHQKKSK